MAGRDLQRTAASERGRALAEEAISAHGGSQAWERAQEVRVRVSSGAYAIWTYVSAPFVFLREGYELRQLDPWEEQGERWRRLAVRFPQGVQTHSREQVFYIDPRGLIRRHDYTAEPFGSWARAAHY